ncbi:uncharacterized protein TNCV_4612061 [Trichonephila clavipes]|nr:uncharacterized protein TNCV_4612061 [Trichonephila clavipes]
MQASKKEQREAIRFLAVRQWLPNHPTTEQLNTRMTLSLSYLQCYLEEEYGFLPPIVTGDKTWGHNFGPEIKGWSKQRKRTTSPPPKKSKVIHTSSGKVKMSFYYLKGSIAHLISGTGNHHQYPELTRHFSKP